MSDVLVEPPIAVEPKVVQAVSPTLSSQKKKKKIIYTIPHLIAISKSPLCQPPPGSPVLVAVKRTGNNKNNRFPAQEGTNKKHETVQSESTSRKGASPSSQLNSQRQQRQNIGSSKSSSVFQFKGRKSSENDQDYLSETSEQGPEPSKGKNKSRDHSRKHPTTSSERGQSNLHGGNVSPIPEWSLNDNLPADPAILAQQQHEFAEWKEQHKQDASNTNHNTNNNTNTNNLSWFEQLNRPNDSSFGNMNNGFPDSAGLVSDHSLDAMFDSLSLQPKGFEQTNPTPETGVQNLDFILKALQSEGPNSGPTNFSNSEFSQHTIQDPAIVAFQDPSIFFAQEASKPPPANSHNFPPNDGKRIPPGYSIDSPRAISTGLGKPPKIVPSANVPTAVLKQFSSKGSTGPRDYNSRMAPNPNPTPAKSSGFNLASFLESRDRQKSQNPSAVSSNSIHSLDSSQSINFTRSNDFPNGQSRISEQLPQSFPYGSLMTGNGPGLSQLAGQNFNGGRHPISGMPQTLPRSSGSNNGSMSSQKGLSHGINSFPALNSSQSSPGSLSGIPLSGHNTIGNMSPQGFNYPGANGLPQSTLPYPGFGHMPGLPNLPMNSFAPNMNHSAGFQFSPYGAPLAPNSPAYMGYPPGAPVNPGLAYGSERDSHFLNRPVSTEDLFAAHHSSQSQGPSRGPPPGNFRDHSYSAWPKPGAVPPPFSPAYGSKSGPSSQF